MNSAPGDKALWSEHATEAELREFLRYGSLPTSHQLDPRLIRHLLAECSICKQRLRAIASGHEAYDYDAAFGAAEQVVADFLAPDGPSEVTPGPLLQELERLSKGERLKAIVHDSRFASVHLVGLLLERSYGFRYKDAEEMAHWAHLAVLAVSACSVVDAGSERRLEDLRGNAWGNLANALRVCGDLSEAEKAIRTAQSHLEAGTGDPVLRAELLNHDASLHMVRGRNAEAAEMAEIAARLYREVNRTQDCAGALVRKAIACQYEGDAEEAITVLNEAIPIIEGSEDPYLLLAACHNLILSYLAAGQPEHALSLYFEARDLYREFDDELILLRVGWQEGQLLRDLGHLQAAEAALLQARKGFMERNLAHEAALVSLDLAWVYVKLGQMEEIKRTVAEAVPIFRSLGVGRDTLAALLQLRHAAGHEQRAIELIRSLSNRLSSLSERNSAR